MPTSGLVDCRNGCKLCWIFYNIYCFLYRAIMEHQNTS
jgi:hypothetical protein